MIFYRHVKGQSASGLYTYLRYSEANANFSEDDLNYSYLPHIFVNNSGEFSGNYDLGYVLTSEVKDGFIVNPFTFQSALYIGQNKFQFNDNKLKYYNEEDEVFKDFLSYSEDTLAFGNAAATCSFVSPVLMTKTLRMGSARQPGTFADGDIAAVNVYIDNKCQSQYFNATSDYRAKKDFKKLEINALDLVKRVQLYSFKYKESNLPSIGIIAQDVQDIDLEGFKLVDNESATGANMDYMTIHESKLVYILWKALQEQQKEIEELKIQLNK